VVFFVARSRFFREERRSVHPIGQHSVTQPVVIVANAASESGFGHASSTVVFRSLCEIDGD
jgi:hypothetical protein